MNTTSAKNENIIIPELSKKKKEVKIKTSILTKVTVVDCELDCDCDIQMINFLLTYK